ncbi:EF-hand domain-containing family member B isoform X2 [Denticeps clupeoides]|uniref:EF-hand domain-containing family member B isoform X2 n=1 Tax=Denticeps clupeoides TaxID=299321 RepID=UPI0010A3241B|nr:EF-hand domain-containing family member B isoform X2 [Denticeps clupeoides]
MTLLEMNNSRRKCRDRFPGIPEAGKIIPRGDSAKMCLQEIIPRPVTPPAVKAFLRTRLSGIGTPCRRGNNTVSNIVHGVKTLTSMTSGGSLCNPKVKTLFQEKMEELQEPVYARNMKAPLGGIKQGPGLPEWIDMNRTTFDIKGGKIINPPKTAEQVEKEALEGHRGYIISHNDYFVGECIDRGYSWVHCGKDTRFGIPTPFHTDGRYVARSLYWPCDKENAKLASSTSDDFRDRTRPITGKVCNLITDLKTAENQTSGTLNQQSCSGSGDLTFHFTPRDLLKGMDLQRALASAVRRDLKRANFYSFHSLLQAFRHYDKKSQGKISKDDLWDVCRQFNLDILCPDLDRLIELCNEDKEGHVNFLEFAHFLKWTDKQEVYTLEHKSATLPANTGRLDPRELRTAEAKSPSETSQTPLRPSTVHGYFTTSTQIGHSVSRLPTADYPRSGLPSTRSDLPPPYVKRISDFVNYGDQPSAYDLLYPTIPSIYGVHEEHYFSSRSKNEVVQIFHNVGLSVPDDTFEEAWELASMRHPTGQVCMDSFLNVLKEIHAI